MDKLTLVNGTEIVLNASGTPLVDCVNPQHDHDERFDDEGNELPEARRMICRHDGLPMHYDWHVEDYRHDDPTVTCFLIPVTTDTLCLPVRGT